MNVIIHDLGPKYDKAIQTMYQTTKDTLIISEKAPIHPCAGCFGCWIKTPGQCVIKDEYQKMGSILGSTESLIVISQNCYGTFSPFIKAIFDRSISYINPDFTKHNGEIHHKRRYKNQLQYQVILYGTATEEEKVTAAALAKANAANFYANLIDVRFLSGKEEVLHENRID